MSLQDAMTRTIVRDPQTGLPLIATIGEVQQRALVERGQRVVQDLQADVNAQQRIIVRLRVALAVLVSESEEEFIEFDEREFEKMTDRYIDDDTIQTPDGRTLWRVWLRGEKAEAALAARAGGLSVVGKEA